MSMSRVVAHWVVLDKQIYVQAQQQKHKLTKLNAIHETIQTILIQVSL